MKRLHVHIAVEDLDRSIGFYTDLFGVAPEVRKNDYAKWMLEDPRVNFAISARGRTAGISHLGLQMEDREDLNALRTRLAAEGHALFEQSDEACCYARSDKVWVADPQGISWENFVTFGELETFGEDALSPAEMRAAAKTPADPQSACCVPPAEH